MNIKDYRSALMRRREQIKKDLGEALARPAPDWGLVRFLKRLNVRVKDRLAAMERRTDGAA